MRSKSVYLPTSRITLCVSAALGLVFDCGPRQRQVLVPCWSGILTELPVGGKTVEQLQAVVTLWQRLRNRLPLDGGDEKNM